MTKVSLRLSLGAAALSACIFSAAAASAQSDAAWPAPTQTAKPWARWWWPGSAVDAKNITRNLDELAQAGVGGVEITPIYGAKGAESRYIDFLSPQFMAMVEHAGKETQRLGMGLDMATGTGWPFGGPWVSKDDVLTSVALEGGKLVGKPTGMIVKRAAPGDVGPVINPYSVSALKDYLSKFDAAFANFPKGLIRSQFHDSFEYYNANWAPTFPEVFHQMHGYDIQQYAAELMGAKPMDAEKLGRLKSDYRETLAKMHLDYVEAWTKWSNDHGFKAREQAHGAPGNLLDLYGAADIPETEIFGSVAYPIPGLRRLLSEVRSDQDPPEQLISRMASSAGHVMGRPLISSESCTWLRDHWKTTLSDAKPELDQVMLSGINHIIYHGNCYSPEDAAWPGWLFYASTQFNDRNTIWHDFPALNHYIERVQSVLQAGQPDNDVLLYWPVYDLWDDTTTSVPLMRQFAVHDFKWIVGTPFGDLATELGKRGYSYDYISDAQLAATKFQDGRLATPGSKYKILLVPSCRNLPVATLKQIIDLAEQGAKVLMGEAPTLAPGLGHQEENAAAFKAQMDRLKFESDEGGLFVASIGKGSVSKGNVMQALVLEPVSREAIAQSGIGFIRRAHVGGNHYFFSNLSAKPLDGWVSIGVKLKSAAIMDPLTDAIGLAAVRPGEAGTGQIYLQLAPGESKVVWTSSDAELKGAPWSYVKEAGEPATIAGDWKIDFVSGGPELPKPIATKELKSWTDIGDDTAKKFGGTARYTVEFDKPAGDVADYMLDLGDVRESARVKLNGKEIATAWSLPFRVRLGDALKPGKNTLELEVTNLAANRIRDLDQRGVNWKIMFEGGKAGFGVAFVNINYKPFDASKWELQPSGLLGPVKLVPLAEVKPE